MAIIDLVETLRLDLADTDKILFKDDVLERCIFKGVYQLGNDLGLMLSVKRGEIEPEPVDDTREMLLLLGQIHACQFMRVKTANAFSFASGDKRVDKTKQPEHWAALEDDLKTIYRQRLSELKPEMITGPEQYIINLPKIKPLIYEQGINI